MKCDIIIPIWNHLEYTHSCIASIIKNTTFPYRLILIDNASSAKTRKYLESFVNRENLEVELIRNDENIGFVRAINQGLKKSNAAYICVMNNDTIVTEGWLAEMVKIADSNPNIGLLNPSSNNLGQHPRSTKIEDYARSLKVYTGEFAEMGACLGFCLLMKRDIFDKVGLFDEIYGVGLFDDTDYSRRVESLGLICARAKAAFVYHRVSKSFLKRGNFENMFRKNEEIFNKRWGRPKRLLYIISKNHRKLDDWIRKESIKKARFGNWIWLFLKGDNSFKIEEHSNIKTFNLPRALFKQNCILRIIARKKKFDAIFVDEDGLREELEKLRNIHEADVMLMGG